MAKTGLCSKEELIRDLRSVLYAAVTELNIMFSGREKLALVDTKSNGVLEFFDDTNKEAIDNFNTSKMAVNHYMLLLYDYVTEGRLEKRLFNKTRHYENAYAGSPALGALKERLSETWDVIDNQITIFRGLELISSGNKTNKQYPLNNILHVIELSLARRRLDFNDFFQSNLNSLEVIPGYLSLQDVALLAEIDIKTARNLALGKSADRLVTENPQGKTLVELNHAKEWLNNRGYKSTQTYDVMFDQPSQSFASDGFFDMRMLSEYVTYHCEKHEINFKQLAKLAAFSIIDPIFMDSEMGEYQYFNQLNFEEKKYETIDILGRIAEVLSFEKWDFVYAAFATNHREVRNEIDAARDHEYFESLNQPDTRSDEK